MKWLGNVNYPSAEVINTASHTLSLYDLAKKITEMFNLKSVKHEINNDLSPDIYTCNTENFKNILQKYKLKLTSISDQIIDTYEYLILKDSH